MKNFLIAILIFVVWSFFGLWLYSVLDGNPNGQEIAVRDSLGNDVETTNPSDSISEASVDSLRTDPSAINENLEFSGGFKAVSDTGDIVFLYDEGIEITKNTADIRIPEAVVDFKYKLNTYFIEHPDKELHILSFYDPSEDLATPNFGEQRGAKVIRELQKVGILRERMVLKPTIKKMEFDSIGHFGNGIHFVFKPLDEDRLKSPTFSVPQPKSIYPKFVNNDIFPNEELRNLLTEMQSVFAANPQVTAEIIGHTDNIGNAQDNYVVGLKYAQQVRWYLISKGDFDRKRIKARSEGENVPITSNNSKKGRLENRRIEVRYINK